MKAVYLCAVCLVAVLVSKTDAQFPFMDGFMGGFAQNMNNMMRNLQGNLANMGQQMSMTQSRQYAQAEAYARDLPPGQGRQINDGNVRGYVFKNMDGSLSYSLSNGGNAGGYFFRSGPEGTFEQRW